MLTAQTIFFVTFHDFKGTIFILLTQIGNLKKPKGIFQFY